MGIINFLTIFGILLQASMAIAASQYWVGAGIGDITGPAADANMMGYANVVQRSNGIHMRVYARAFIFSDGPHSKNRFVYVSADMCMMSEVVKLGVVEKLNATYGNLYTARNVILSGTHTHSTPGGFLEHFVFGITSFGFLGESYGQYVRGIVDAIEKAHNDLQPASLYLKSGQLLHTQKNRSPTSYLRNPPSERARYQADTDPSMHLLRINNAQGKPIGMVNWYAVHGVSMTRDNDLISGDNKGYASQMFERIMEPQSLPGSNKFVGAFAQGAEGDVSPNVAGPHCIDTGLPCDNNTSTCDGSPHKCVGFGPGKNMFESTKIIGEHQLKKALELFEGATDNEITGGLTIAHHYVNMTNVHVHLDNGQIHSTCSPALGYSFAAGCTDGPSELPIGQGTLKRTLFWDVVRDLFKKPTLEMEACQSPKPILLATGLMDHPYPWHPKIVDVQIAKIGQLVIVAVPGEFTTMSGRRLSEAITKLFANSGEQVQVVIAGLSNVYTHYITTPEEYTNQRYEGASTIYGPYSLPAYVQLFKEAAKSIITGRPMPEGPKPPFLRDRMWSLLPPVMFDSPGLKQFGDVISEPKPSYRPGEVVNVSFVGAHPRNSMGTDLRSFLNVEKLVQGNARVTREASTLFSKIGNAMSGLTHKIFGGKQSTSGPSTNESGMWQTSYTDASWETRFYWRRDFLPLGISHAILEWDIPANVEEGTYRVCYHGHRKRLTGSVEPIEGCSHYFTVTRNLHEEENLRLHHSPYLTKNKS